MSITDPNGQNFAARLFEQLLPFQNLDTLGHLWALCDGIGAMFEEVEDLTADRDDGLAGWANLVDIDAIDASNLGYLAQFVGTVLKAGLSDDEQRDWVRSLPGFARGRPATIKAVAQTTLTGTKHVRVRERQNGSAWQQVFITKVEETPNPAVTLAALLTQKPGPDLFFHLVEDYIDYIWVKNNEATYQSLKDNFATYGDLADHTM